MTIHVEFYGIPRQRAGCAQIDVDAADLATLLMEVGQKLPQLENVCMVRGQLKAGYLANINGRTFVSDANTALVDGDSVLILSADGGG